MGHLNRWVREDRELLVIKYRSQGLTYKQIKELTGLGLTTIANILRKYGKGSEVTNMPNTH